MQERLKKIREYFHMTQAELAKKLGVGQSTLAMMEVSKRDISERHIKTICAIFNIREEWLRTGNGSMLIETNDSVLSEVAAQYSLNELDQAMLKLFLELPPEKKEIIKDFAYSLIDTVLNNDALRIEYLNQHNKGNDSLKTGLEKIKIPEEQKKEALSATESDQASYIELIAYDGNGIEIKQVSKEKQEEIHKIMKELHHEN